MKRFFRKRLLNPLILGFIVFLFICGVQAVDECVAAEPVRLQLRWDHQFQFAGYYCAQWQGYYADAGLEVDIRSAIRQDGSIVSAVDAVVSGRADFGIGAADILIARDKGDPLVVVASIFQESAAGFYFLAETGVRSPADLSRLKVARRVDDLIDTELQALLLAEGIDPSRVPPHPHQPGLDHLASGQVDVIPGYRITVPFFAEREGVQIQSLAPASYGVDFYGDALFTHQRLIDEYPEMVERFRDASVKGWAFALANPVAVAEEISARLRRTAQTPDYKGLNLFQAERIAELMHYPLVEIGHTNPDRWRRMHEQLKQIDQVGGRLDTDDFVFDPNRSRQVKNEKGAAL
jgi:ABC-type nitrate/sulfonate/bicarbonate transport system substrate-binding protein